MEIIKGRPTLSASVNAKNIFDAVANYGIDHFCAAPIVLASIASAPETERRHHREHSPCQYSASRRNEEIVIVIFLLTHDGLP